MAQKKPYFIQINGAKIVKNQARTKIAIIEEVVIDDQKFNDWQAASSFAELKARNMQIKRGWDRYNLTVIEWVPVREAGYSLHLVELTRILKPFFDHHWEMIMDNQVIVRAKSRLEDNDYRLLHDIIRSFIDKLSPEFVKYNREVRNSDRKSFEQALRDLVIDNYIARPAKLDSESAGQ